MVFIKLWGVCVFVFGDACVWMPRRIPRVLSVFCYLMTFLWLRPAARSLAVGTVCIVLIAVRVFFFKGIIGYTCQEGDFSPGLLVRAACCHHASVGDSSRLIGEKRKGKRLQFFFFQWWLLSTYTLLLIYSNCGWDSLLTAKKLSFSEDLIGFFLLHLLQPTTHSICQSVDFTFIISSLFIPISQHEPKLLSPFFCGGHFTVA